MDGDFKPEEALELYGVSIKDFENFVAKYLLEELHVFFVDSYSKKTKTLALPDVIKELYKEHFSFDKVPID